MKKHFLKSFALLAMLFSALTISAATYCGETITATDGTTTAVLTCTQPEAGKYVMIVTSSADNFMGLIGENNYFELDGVGGTKVKNNNSSEKHTCSFDETNRTLTITLNCTNAPKMYTPLYLNIGGQKEFNTIQNQVFEWPTSCEAGEEGGEEETDTEAPVLTSVELFGAAQNFVLLTPTATDDKGVTSYLIAQSGGAESEVTPDATTGQIKIASLTLGKEYTYSVKAKDAAGNVSAAKEITFSTLDRIFCEEEILPNVQFTTNQKLTFTAKKVSNTETLFTLTSSTSTLTKMFNVNLTNAGSGVLPAGYVWKDDWTLTDNTLSKTVTWETYPTNPITIAITANRTPGAGENNLIGLSYSMDISNTCGEEPTPEPEETIIADTHFAPNWVVDPTSSATYDANTGTITVDLKNQFNAQWQAQVKVKHDVDFSADKQYTFSAKFHATAQVEKVTIKVDDNNGMIFADQSITLPANTDYVYTSDTKDGIAGNNKIIVFDFGYATPCQITISDIVIEETDKPADAEAPVMVSASLVEGSETHNSAVLSVSATDNVGVTNYRVVDATNSYDETFAPVDNQITLTGLTPSTDYNFTVTALDLAGNESTNNATVAVSTIALLYCDLATGHQNNANFGDPNGRCLLTLTKLNDTQVRITVKPNYANGTTKKMDYLYVISGGATPYPAEAGADITEGGYDELSVDITYSTAPSTYSFTIQWSNVGDAGRWQVNLNDVLDANLCPAPADEEAPVMGTATLVEGSETHNSAILTVSATDNEGVTSYRVVDNAKGYDATINPIGNQITLTGLTPSTDYNFTVTALDLAGNESTNNATVEVSTIALLYCDFATGHQNNANFGDSNGRCLLTLTKLSDTQVRITVKPNYANGATKKLDYLYVTSPNGTPYPATVGAHATEGGYEELSVDISYASTLATYSYSIQWSNVNDGTTTWLINLNNVLESNLCPLPADDEAPVMVSASLVTGSETYNSAVLTVSATDNDEVANYHVVDAANSYDATIAPIGNQITLTGLTPSTDYNFTVTALDLAGNESENSKTVAVSTLKLEYCEWIVGSEGKTDWTDPNRLCLLTISKVTDKQLLVVAKPVSGANKLDFLQIQADGAPHQTINLSGKTAADELSCVLDFANTITEIPLFRFLWSNEGVDGNWMVDLTNVKASYLCPHVELGESVDLSKLDLSAGITTDVKITRKFVKGNGKWNTLSLPFALSNTEIQTLFAGAKVVELSGATLVTSNDIDLSVTEVSAIAAGKPYLIQLPATYAPAVIENITLSNTITEQETTTSNGLAKMVSVLTPIPFDDAAGGIRFFLNTNGKLSYRSTTNGIMNPYRAYFVFPHINDPATASQVRARVVFNENEATGLDNLTTEDAPIKIMQNGQLIIIRGGVKYNVQGQKL